MAGSNLVLKAKCWAGVSLCPPTPQPYLFPAEETDNRSKESRIWETLAKPSKSTNWLLLFLFPHLLQLLTLISFVSEFLKRLCYLSFRNIFLFLAYSLFSCLLFVRSFSYFNFINRLFDFLNCSPFKRRLFLPKCNFSRSLILIWRMSLSLTQRLLL